MILFYSSDDEDSQHSTPYNQEQVDKEKFARFVTITVQLTLVIWAHLGPGQISGDI